MYHLEFTDQASDDLDNLEKTPSLKKRLKAVRKALAYLGTTGVSKILNHVDNSITAIYDRHSYDTEKKNALEAWSKKLTQIISPDKVPNNVIDLSSPSKIRAL